MRILRVKRHEYGLHKEAEKGLYKDMQKGLFCSLFNTHNIRKKFLTRNRLSMRKRILLRIDMACYATKSPF